LKGAAAGPVTLEIVDGAGTVVRRYRSDDTPEPPVEGRNIPDYWIRPPQVLSTAAGLHRFVWDLHHPPPPAAKFTYPISAIYANTPREPRGPWAVPGTYTVRLTVDGRTFTQPLVLKMDPRVKTPPEGLQAQFDRSKDVTADMARTLEALRVVRTEQGQAKSMPPARIKVLADRESKLTDLNAKLTSLYTTMQEADMPPTAAMVEAAQELRRQAAEAVASDK